MSPFLCVGRTGPRGWDVHGKTHPGRVRARNEDAFGVWSDPPLWVVADGMGGHRGGPEASRVTVERVAAEWRDGQGPPPGRLDDGVRSADRAVRSAAEANPDLAGMGCTVVAAAPHGRHLHVVHLGDARCYVLTRHGLTRVTRDHSLVEELVASGTLAPEEALGHPRRNVVTRAVGAGVDTRPEATRWALDGVEAVLLCTDGLWGAVPETAVETVLRRASGAEDACRALVDRANAAGGRDNITVVVAVRGG